MSNSENIKEKTTQLEVKADGDNDLAQSTAPVGASDIETIARDIKEGRLSCFIGSDSSLDGELDFRLMARIDGQITGKIKSEKGTLIVGVSGQVDAGVSVATAIINGTINGDVFISEHLELRSTAKIVGNIRTPRLIMEDGAILEGNCAMIKREEKTENPAVKPVTAAAAATTFRSTLSVKPSENPSKDTKPSDLVDTSKDTKTLMLDVI